MPDRKPAERLLSGEDFRNWRLTRGLTQLEVGTWLGVSYQMVRKLEKTGLDRVYCLALSAIERGLKPWQPTEEDRRDAKNIGKESGGLDSLH